MKTYKATVRTRQRITIPYDCWMDCDGITDLKLKHNETIHKWKAGVGMTPNLAFRVTVDFPEGTQLELTPNKKNKTIMVKEL